MEARVTIAPTRKREINTSSEIWGLASGLNEGYAIVH
jgi:hypothetical protein